jgi:acyl-CoA synthetase (NDP forming)
MLTREIEKILSAAEDNGWVMEPEAKRLFSAAGLDVPRFSRATTGEEAIRFAKEIGFPVVCKVVSPQVLHKSDRNGVVVGIESERTLTETFTRLSQIEGFAGMLVEEMLFGVELIVGAKVDYQFGPVILLGIGGTGVEIYRDVALRMAPLAEKDIESMITGLKAHQLLEGYRGSEPVNLEELARLLKTFSGLAMDLQERIDSIDLNPVICSSSRCVVADARIILKVGRPGKVERSGG